MQPRGSIEHPTNCQCPVIHIFHRNAEDTGIMMSALPEGLNHRALSMLRAVVAGRAQISCSSEPDLFIDGVPCCDQYLAHTLAHEGFIAPARRGAVGTLVPAALTATGQAALDPAPAAA
jgi:hypothetical protein